MSTDNGTVVVARDVTRRYGEGETAVDALRGISVEVPRGKLTAVMGPSGSGKSTLMHILAGLDKPTSGSVTIAGKEITTLKDSDLTKLRREHIGFVFQFFNLLPMLSAEENIRLPLAIAGEKPDGEFFDGLVKSVGLGDRLSHRPAELSGGQQQRVAIARALVSQPDVVFADEPTGNLDSHTGHEILELLRHSVEDLGQTIVMVTHEARAAAIADRVLYLADGADRARAVRRVAARDQRGDGGDRRPMTRVRAQGPPHPQAPHRADRDRDRPRRRDGERDVRPHRLDRQGVRRDLHRRLPEHRRDHHPEVGVRLERRLGSTEAAFDESLLAKVKELPDVQDAIGGVASENTQLVKDGKAIAFGGAPNLGFSVDPTKPQFNSLTLVQGAWPRRERGRGRQVDRRQEGPAGRRQTIGVQVEGPRRDSSRSRASSSSGRSARSAARRWPGSTSRPPSGSSTRRASSTRSASPRSRASRPSSSIAQIQTILPPGTEVRTGDAQAREDAKDDRRVHLLPPLLPARVRR